MEFGLGTDAAVDAGDLPCPRQTQLLRFNRPGDDGTGFPASTPVTVAHQYRGEGPPAGVAGRFQAGLVDSPAGLSCNRRLSHRGFDERFYAGYACHRVAPFCRGVLNGQSGSGPSGSRWPVIVNPSAATSAKIGLGSRI